ERQRDKMTQDIAKFVRNRPILQRILGTVRITRWALFVPHYDSKDILAHATRKTEEVKAATLPYVADSFQVCVCQQAEFTVAEHQLLNGGQRQLHMPPSPVTEQQIADWAEANQGPSRVLSDKLRRLTTLINDNARSAFHTKVLDWYLK